MEILNLIRKFLNFLEKKLNKLFSKFKEISKKLKQSSSFHKTKLPDVHNFLDELINSLKMEGVLPPSKNNILDVIDVIAYLYRQELLKIITDSTTNIEEKKQKLKEFYNNPFKSEKLIRLEEKLRTIMQEKARKYKPYVKPEQLPWGLRITLKTYGLDTIEDLEELFENLRKKIFERGFEEVNKVINIIIEEINQCNNSEKLKELIERKLKNRLINIIYF